MTAEEFTFKALINIQIYKASTGKYPQYILTDKDTFINIRDAELPSLLVNESIIIGPDALMYRLSHTMELMDDVFENRIQF